MISLNSSHYPLAASSNHISWNANTYTHASNHFSFWEMLNFISKKYFFSVSLCFSELQNSNVKENSSCIVTRRNWRWGLWNSGGPGTSVRCWPCCFSYFCLPLELTEPGTSTYHDCSSRIQVRNQLSQLHCLKLNCLFLHFMMLQDFRYLLGQAI